MPSHTLWHFSSSATTNDFADGQLGRMGVLYVDYSGFLAILKGLRRLALVSYYYYCPNKNPPFGASHTTFEHFFSYTRNIILTICFGVRMRACLRLHYYTCWIYTRRNKPLRRRRKNFLVYKILPSLRNGNKLYISFSFPTCLVQYLHSLQTLRSLLARQLTLLMLNVSNCFNHSSKNRLPCIIDLVLAQCACTVLWMAIWMISTSCIVSRLTSHLLCYILICCVRA